MATADPEEPLVAVDLFAGAGGLTQGLKDAGIRVLAAVEIDSLASETYSLNHPEVDLATRDIRRVDPRELVGKYDRRVDFVAACPPCQGFSTLRTNRRSKVVADSRNDLVFEALR